MHFGRSAYGWFLLSNVWQFIHSIRSGSAYPLILVSESLRNRVTSKRNMRTILLGLVVCTVGMGMISTGCTKRPPTGPAAIASAAPPLPGGPVHLHGPHGGHAVNLGYIDHSAELLFAPGDPVVGVYSLGADITKMEPIDAQSVSLFALVDGKVTEYKLPGVHQDGDPPNKFSYFELTSQPLYEIATSTSMAIRPRLRMGLTIEGMPYSGEVDLSSGSHLSIAQNLTGGLAEEPIVWQKQLSEGEFRISLGHFGVLLMAGDNVQPAMELTRGDQPVTDAKVFVTLLGEDAKTELAAETATAYQPPTATNAGHYGKGLLKIPPRTRQAVIRYRVVLPENKGEHSYDLPVSVR